MSKKGTGQPAPFRRASYCAAGECVEVAQHDDVITLRDSAQPHGGVINYAAEDWRSFIRRVKAGRLDTLGS
jgi:hypothetical protein